MKDSHSEGNFAPGMNIEDHAPTCKIRTTRDGWEADCSCKVQPPALPASEGAQEPLPEDAVGDLLAYGQEESTSALKGKDRDQYQFWQGWNAALQRLAALSVASEGSKETALLKHAKDFLDGYNTLKPSEKMERGSALALAVSLVQQLAAALTGASE